MTKESRSDKKMPVKEKKEFDPSAVQDVLHDRLPQYTRIKDCIAGADAIKKKSKEYLPMPAPEDTTEKNILRYRSYIERAVFYNITARTVIGLVGLAFSKPIPVLEIPDTLDYLKTNIDGAGITLEQQIKKTTAEVVSLGRCGLLTDYSKDKAKSQQDILDGRVRATIILLEASDIVWVETTESGVQVVLCLVVIKEAYSSPTGDGYTTKTDVQYKVLFLREGVYTQEIWRKAGDAEAWVMAEEALFPTDHKGNLLDHIPFTFVGSLNNDATFDEPPMLSIADLNIAHFRNSADAEESSFIHGQPTLVVTGLTESWLKGVLKGKVSVGARGGLPLPRDADAKLLQVGANSMPVEGMKEKEKQMTAIGARIVADTSGKKTATEINRDSDVENSELSSIMLNVEQAYQFCFNEISLYSGIAALELELTKKFSAKSFDYQVYTSLINGAMQGVGQKLDIFNYLKDTDMVEQEITYSAWLENIAMEIPPVIEE